MEIHFEFGEGNAHNPEIIDLRNYKSIAEKKLDQAINANSRYELAKLLLEGVKSLPTYKANDSINSPEDEVAYELALDFIFKSTVNAHVHESSSEHEDIAAGLFSSIKEAYSEIRPEIGTLSMNRFLPIFAGALATRDVVHRNGAEVNPAILSRVNDFDLAVAIAMDSIVKNEHHTSNNS